MDRKYPDPSQACFVHVHRHTAAAPQPSWVTCLTGTFRPSGAQALLCQCGPEKLRQLEPVTGSFPPDGLRSSPSRSAHKMTRKRIVVPRDREGSLAGRVTWLYNEKLLSLALEQKNMNMAEIKAHGLFITTIGGGGQWKGLFIEEEVLIGRLFSQGYYKKKNDQTLGGLQQKYILLQS